MDKMTEKYMRQMFQGWSGETAQQVAPLPRSGSDREYYRIEGQQTKALGAYNPNRKENKAFIEFSRHFSEKGLRVPQIYDTDLDKNIYLLQDLGDTTLFSYLSQVYKDGIFPGQLIDLYKKVIHCLPEFQIKAGRDLDYDLCYPRKAFDQQSMMWDLNYFKYYFLKLAKISFDEQELENDFQELTHFLTKADCSYFLYRDFQSRNVMLFDSEPYFIDYQGGRKGALQYDLASLLYDAKADIPPHIRKELYNEYITVVSEFMPLDEQQFRDFYNGYVFIRIMQAMGSYGFRGFYERKEHFLLSIPYALDNIQYLLDNMSLSVKLPTLMDIMKRMVQSDFLKQLAPARDILKVTINSFSFKKGIPVDPTGNGGGFVFDCRAIRNPGRYDRFKPFSGKDKPVIDFFHDDPKITQFLEHVYQLVDLSVANYQKRRFSHLMVNFGCTGGQHRSVYCAEQLAKHLQKKFDIKIELNHTEGY